MPQKKYLETFFDSKERAFYAKGIEYLPSEWQEVINNNGAYIVQN